MSEYSVLVQRKFGFSRAIFGEKDPQIVSELEFTVQFAPKYRYMGAK